ncbi:glutathione S-transferase family protein [Pseudaestuariivita sp.]|uniref:glutathione S-transferase family protein n=1 Tax=Pseudaestuariivita sp. TaxID=2211669 RepID=UPI0040583616
MPPILYYAPLTRASTIRSALLEMEVTEHVTLRQVSVKRGDGSGAADPANSHPEGKVPLLDVDGQLIWERPAILIALSEMFPDAPAICPPGHADRGSFLSWLSYYSAVMEPVLVNHAAGLTHPMLHATFRGPEEMADRLEAALAGGQPYLLPCGFTVADLLLASPFAWMPDATPDRPAVRDWVQRVNTRPSVQQITAEEMRDAACA